jgi:hypothetical protein
VHLRVQEVDAVPPLAEGVVRIKGDAEPVGHLPGFDGQLAAEIAIMEMELHTVAAVCVGPCDTETVVWTVANHHQGVSDRHAAALRFLWGEPYPIEGWAGHYEYWYYMDSSLALASHGTPYNSPGTMVQVYLVDGRVEWWLDFVPTTGDNDDFQKQHSVLRPVVQISASISRSWATNFFNPCRSNCARKSSALIGGRFRRALIS